MSSRILIRGVNWLGDAVMSAPAIQAVRRAFPNARIMLLCPEKLKDLWIGHPAADEVISFPAKAGLLQVARMIAAARPDMVFVFPNSTRSALEPWLARVPSRIGYGGHLRSLFLTRVVPRKPRPRMRKRSDAEIAALIATNQPRSVFPPEAHHAFDYLELVQPVCGPSRMEPPSLHLSSAERAACAKKFGVDPGKLLIGINPGAEYGPAKRWPVERFIQTALELDSRVDAGWIIFGGKGDLAIAGEIETALTAKSAGKVINLSGKTSLRELCAALTFCKVLLTNDTGPMHAAAALGVPVVALFGSTSPELTGPGEPGRALKGVILGQASCAPCFRRECPVDFRCMKSIGPGQVAARALELLGIPGNSG